MDINVCIYNILHEQNIVCAIYCIYITLYLKCDKYNIYCTHTVIIFNIFLCNLLYVW